jgi:hypothetical protein
LPMCSASRARMASGSPGIHAAVVFEYTGSAGVPHSTGCERSRANASHAPCTSWLWNAHATGMDCAAMLAASRRSTASLHSRRRAGDDRLARASSRWRSPRLRVR